jgi:putative GTP pyrophosphokinase
MQPVDEATFKEFIENRFPPPYNSMERWEEYICDKIKAHSPALQSVMAAVENTIKSLNKEYSKKEKRFLAKVSRGEENIKSPKRIVEKIISQPDKYTIENFDREMEDIARLRIVCNYLSDIFEVAERLKADNSFNACCKILDEKDYIFKNRNRPHRALQFVLEVPMQDMPRKVELQIMTLLQEAWDKKDHNLIYEKERIGKEIDQKDKIKMHSMSDLLYIADEFFDSLRKKILNIGGKNE